MDKYLLCGEFSLSSRGGGERDDGSDAGSSQEVDGRLKVYKGRRRGTIEFCGIWKHSKVVKELVANGVSLLWCSPKVGKGMM